MYRWPVLPRMPKPSNVATPLDTEATADVVSSRKEPVATPPMSIGVMSACTYVPAGSDARLPATSLNVTDGCVVKAAPAAVPTALVSTMSVAGPATTTTSPVTLIGVPFNVAVNVSV